MKYLNLDQKRAGFLPQMCVNETALNIWENRPVCNDAMP